MKIPFIFGVNLLLRDLFYCSRQQQSHYPAAIQSWDRQQTEPEKITNINDVLDDLIQQSVALVGKPVAVMNKDDKVKAIQFLNQNGAFLVTKSGDKVAKYFGISKYTLYSYIDSKQEGK